MTGKVDQPNTASRLRLSLRRLEVFVATAREGSTRAAADRVARSQSAASTALADLEAVFGVQLFDRLGRRLVLNENGRALLPRAQSLLEQAAELEALFSGRHAAPLRVAASFTIGEYLLPERIASWTRKHPASPVRMQIANTHDVIAAVAAFDADVGFVEGPETHPDVVTSPWLDDALIVVAAPDHPLARKPATARRLANATWALREHGSGTRQVTDGWLLRHLGRVQVGYELGSTEAIKRVVAAGGALGCLSRHAVAQDLDDGRLVELQTRLPAATRSLATVVHRDRHLGRATLEFLRHCGAAIAR
ncbi:MAG: LysR family transcriptional regulator [Proteobacteria bacterium]|nr:LysR family transcriptional regulator [Pseudomonadota bacterium]